MELKTEKGLKYFNIGFILYIIALAVLLVVLIAFFLSLSTFFADLTNIDPSTILGTLLGFLAGLCGGLIVIVIALILFLIGLILIITGREEFGEAHSKSAMRGFIFIIMAIIVGIVGGMIGNTIGAGISVFSTVCYSLGLMFLIYEISDNTGKKILLTAAIVYVIIGVIIAILTIWLYSTLGLWELSDGYPSQDPSQLMGSLSAVMVIATALGSLGLIPIVIFFFAYRRTYKRIKIGEIQPVEPT